MITWAELVRLDRIHDQPALNLPPRYNVAPTQDVPICRLVDGRRAIALARWGLVPAWSKDLKIGVRCISGAPAVPLAPYLHASP